MKYNTPKVFDETLRWTQYVSMYGYAMRVS